MKGGGGRGGGERGLEMVGVGGGGYRPCLNFHDVEMSPGVRVVYD